MGGHSKLGLRKKTINGSRHDNREIVKCSMALNLGLPRMD